MKQRDGTKTIIFYCRVAGRVVKPGQSILNGDAVMIVKNASCCAPRFLSLHPPLSQRISSLSPNRNNVGMGQQVILSST